MREGVWASPLFDLELKILGRLEQKKKKSR